LDVSPSGKAAHLPEPDLHTQTHDEHTGAKKTIPAESTMQASHMAKQNPL